MIPYNSLNIRLSHPNLYYSVMVFACIYIALGLNFFFTTPTFNPYQIPYPIVGAVFLALGISKIVFLNFIRNIKIVRVLMALSVGYSIWWGIGTSITYFQGRTSLQLFVLYAGMAALEIFWLVEPFVNPMTQEGTKPEGSP